MNWKEQLERYEYDEEWQAALDLMGQTINSNSNSVEAYIRVIYLLHNILLEEDYTDEEHDDMATLLKQYFDESYKKFSEDAEYLFFIGKILHVAEWYFGINEGMKPVEQTLAFKMQKRAFEKEPDNALYEWAYHFSIGDEKVAAYLAEQLLLYNEPKIAWLKSKGFPGKYLLETIKWCQNNYEEKTGGVKEIA